MAKIIGIDLGTTFSAAAAITAGESKIIENKERYCVYYNPIRILC